MRIIVPYLFILIFMSCSQLSFRQEVDRMERIDFEDPSINLSDFLAVKAKLSGIWIGHDPLLSKTPNENGFKIRFQSIQAEQFSIQEVMLSENGSGPKQVKYVVIFEFDGRHVIQLEDRLAPINYLSDCQLKIKGLLFERASCQ